MQPFEPWQREITLPRWQIQLTLVAIEDGSYCVVREICGVLGLKSPRDQITRLRESDVFSEYMRQLRIMTAGGRQLTWCLHLDALPFYLGSVNTKLVEPAIAKQLIKFQKELMAAARNLLFGIVNSEPQSKILQIQDYLGARERPTIPEDDDA